MILFFCPLLWVGRVTVRVRLSARDSPDSQIRVLALELHGRSSTQVFFIIIKERYVLRESTHALYFLRRVSRKVKMHVRVELLLRAVVCLALESFVWALPTPAPLTPTTKPRIPELSDHDGRWLTTTPAAVHDDNVSASADFAPSAPTTKQSVREPFRDDRRQNITTTPAVESTTDRDEDANVSSVSDFTSPTQKKTLLKIVCPDENRERYASTKWTAHPPHRNLYWIKAGGEIRFYENALQYIRDLRAKDGVELSADNTSALNIIEGNCNHTMSYTCHRYAHVGYKNVAYTFTVKNCTVSREAPPAKEKGEIVTSTRTRFSTVCLYHLLFILGIVLFIVTIVGIAYYA